jgi:HEAT repeat protein
MRQIAAEILGQLRDTRAVEPLITVLRSADYWPVRQAAAEALAQLGDTRAVGPLIAILKDEHGDVRWAAATLGQLATKLATEHCRTIAHRLWWEAATPDQPDVYEPLLSIATRLVVLEVERLPAPKYPDF